MIKAAIAIAVPAVLALAGCAQPPLLGSQARIGETTVEMPNGTPCAEPGETCTAPILTAGRSDVLELGVTAQVELSLIVLPEADLAPVQDENGRWSVPLDQVQPGTYLLTVMPGPNAAQVQVQLN